MVEAPPVLSEEKRGVLPAALLLAVLLFHAIRCLALFQPVSSLFSEDPLLVGDYPMHLVSSLLSNDHFDHARRFWGYESSFCAGWMHPTALPPSTMALKMLTVALCPPFNASVLFKLAVFLSAAVSPALFVLGAYWLGQRGWSLLVCAVLCVLYWWLGLPHRMIKWGVFLYPLVAHGGVMAHGLLAHVSRKPSWRGWTALAFLWTALVLLHPYGILIVSIPSLVLLSKRWKRAFRWLPLVVAIGLPGAFLSLKLIWLPTVFFLEVAT